jgi:hypothetical protein
MSDEDLGTAVDGFLADVDRVYGEYDQGYMDADVALDRIEGHVEELRRVVED